MKIYSPQILTSLEITGSLAVTGSLSVSGPQAIEGLMTLTGSIIPQGDRQHNLGTPDNRWANMYTGDLHLRNDRGDWTIVEEHDFLMVVNNKTNKRYKMALIPLGGD